MMAGQKKDTARKSIGGAAKRVQLNLAASDWVLRSTPQSPSAAPFTTASATNPPPISLPMEVDVEKVDVMEVDPVGRPSTDDVRCFFKKLAWDSKITSGAHFVPMAT